MRPGTHLLHILTAIAVASAALAPGMAAARVPGVAALQEPMELARELYTEGESLYSAADYNGAIKKFTEALTIVSKHGSVSDAQVRGLLMFNIARAHIQAFDVDEDLSHLRQARSIYQRFVSEAPTAGYAESDIADAEAEITALQQRIEEIDAERRGRDAPPPTVPGETTGGVDVDKLDRAQRMYGVGLGLTIGGAVFVGGGIAAVAWGASVDGFIYDEIDRRRAADCRDGLPTCLDPLDKRSKSELTEDEEGYFEEEKLKGNIWVGVGAAALTVGAASVGVGAWQLVRSKRLKAEARGATVQVVPVVNREHAGLMFSGRF